MFCLVGPHTLEIGRNDQSFRHSRVCARRFAAAPPWNDEVGRLRQISGVCAVSAFPDGPLDHTRAKFFGRPIWSLKHIKKLLMRVGIKKEDALLENGFLSLPECAAEHELRQVLPAQICSAAEHSLRPRRCPNLNHAISRRILTRFHPAYPFTRPTLSRSTSGHSSLVMGYRPRPGVGGVSSCSIAHWPIARCGRMEVVSGGKRWRAISSSS